MLEIFTKHNMRLTLVDKVCKYEMDLVSILEDTERTRFCTQTDRRMDGQTGGQTDKVKPVYPLQPLNNEATCEHKHYLQCNRPATQIPQCTSPMYHNSLLCNKNVHTCAHFCYKGGALWYICLMHCGICEISLLVCKFRIHDPWMSLIVPPESTRHDDITKWNNFRVTGLLCGEFIGHRWIPHTKTSDAELWCFLWSAPE